MSVEPTKPQRGFGWKKRALYSGTLVVAVSVAISLWWFLGVVVPREFSSSREGAGQFGDMFGAANALFSLLAFVGVIVALLLQSQSTTVAKKTAILQSHVFLAEFHYDLMQGSKGRSLRSSYREKTERYVRRAISLMKDMEEEFPFDFSPLDEVEIRSDDDGGVDELRRALNSLRLGLHTAGQDRISLTSSLVIGEGELKIWLDDYAANNNREGVDRLRIAAGMIKDLHTAMLNNQEGPEEDWEEYRQRIHGIVQTLLFAASTIRASK